MAIADVSALITFSACGTLESAGILSTAMRARGVALTTNITTNASTTACRNARLVNMRIMLGTAEWAAGTEPLSSSSSAHLRSDLRGIVEGVRRRLRAGGWST